MSELINNKEKRIEKLLEYSIGIIEGKKNKKYVEQYQQYIDMLTAHDVMHVVDMLINKGISISVLKTSIGKILNIFYKPLESKKWKNLKKIDFLNYLIQENDEVQKILESIKTLLKKINKEKEPFNSSEFSVLKSKISELKKYIIHYDKKENILFPYIEKRTNNFRCTQLMWAFHDDIRNSLKKLLDLLETDNIKAINVEIGKIFFLIKPIIFREEYILFPAAMDFCDKRDWNKMMEQSLEIGYAYIKQPKEKISINNEAEFDFDNLIDLKTGVLSAKQIILMMNNLPVDITFIDENDEVRYFSNPKERIFTRSFAIVGRKVQNCHPPDSVDVVNKIIDSFKNGEKDLAKFWIQIKDKFILIQYFALRDENNNYKGVIEVSQNVSDIRKLKGEKRLLSW